MTRRAARSTSWAGTSGAMVWKASSWASMTTSWTWGSSGGVRPTATVLVMSEQYPSVRPPAHDRERDLVVPGLQQEIAQSPGHGALGAGLQPGLEQAAEGLVRVAGRSLQAV